MEETVGHLINQNLKEKEIKYLILEILDKKKFPIDLFQLINLIQEQRQLVNDSKDFIQNYILTHCEGIDLIDDLGVIKAILSAWNKENKYKLYQINSSSLNIDYAIPKK